MCSEHLQQACQPPLHTEHSKFNAVSGSGFRYTAACSQVLFVGHVCAFALRQNVMSQSHHTHTNTERREGRHPQSSTQKSETRSRAWIFYLLLLLPSSLTPNEAHAVRVRDNSHDERQKWGLSSSVPFSFFLPGMIIFFFANPTRAAAQTSKKSNSQYKNIRRFF